MDDGVTRWRDLTPEQQRDHIRQSRQAKRAIRLRWQQHVIGHPRNVLFVLIAKIGGARRAIAHGAHPGRDWWRLQPASIQRLLAGERTSHGRAR